MALGPVPGGSMSGNVPVIAGEVYYPCLSVTIKLIHWPVERGRASLQRALIDGVCVLHIEMNPGGSRTVFEHLAPTDHNHRVVNPYFGVNPAGRSYSAVKLFRAKCSFHKVY